METILAFSSETYFSPTHKMCIRTLTVINADLFVLLPVVASKDRLHCYQLYCCCCVADGLFGTCVRAFDEVPSELHQHRLTPAQRSQLEFVLTRLIESGYVWADDYTQCVIAGILLTYRTGTEYNLYQCDVEQQRDATRSRLQLDGLERGGYDDVDYTVPLDDYESTVDQVQTPYGEVPIQEAERWDDVDVERRKKPSNVEFDEFLNGLSDEDIVDLEKYVANDLQSAGEMQKKMTRPVYEYGDEADDFQLSENSDR